MSSRRTLNTLPQRFTSLLESRLGIDTRALAAFRISVGLVLIADLVLRARNLGRFYTNDGVFPVTLLAEQTPILAEVSLHAQSGEAWFQIVLFSVAIVVALALVFGYKTRIATVISLVLLLSLHTRNPHLLSGGDSLLQHLLFWSLFLPLGERWSVDSHHNSTTRDRILSIASAGILIQVLLVYVVNAIVKHRSDMWMSGEAVSIILGLDRQTVLLGPPLRNLPMLLDVANWIWIVLLMLSPLLVLSSGRIRTALVVAFAGMHFGMLLTMHLGIFPVISMVALLPFLPPSVWNKLESLSAVGQLRTRITRILSGLANGLPRRTVAPTAILSHRWRRQSSRTIAAIALVGIFLFNAMGLGFLPVPAPVDNSLDDEYIDSRWTLFAPHPPSTDRWFVAPGERESGDRVDVYHQTELRWDRPPDIAETYSSSRARKYMSNFRHDESLQAAFGRYLCDRWNRNHANNLISVEVYAVDTPSLALDDESKDRMKLVNRSCRMDS